MALGANAMSMSQPIFVVLVGSTADIVRRAKKHFRLSAPGIGPAYLASLESSPSDNIQSLTQLPTGLITLWVALDAASFFEAQIRHRIDLQNPRYDRGFYAELFPEPCILVDLSQSSTESKTRLAELALSIIDAWYATS